MKQPTLTIGIITMNESKRIANCINSCSFADEVILMDSGSTDNTLEIAKELGVVAIINNNWQGTAVQRNRIMQYVQTDYVLFVDADEIVTPELAQEIRDVMATGDNAIYKVFWDQYAFGSHLKRMKTHHAADERFIKVNNLAKFNGIVHGYIIPRDPVTKRKAFKNRFIHYSRDTIYGAMLKMAQYSQLGAIHMQTHNEPGGIANGFWHASKLFCRFYIKERAILCGGPGFLFALFIALEHFFRSVIRQYDTNPQVVKKPGHY